MLLDLMGSAVAGAAAAANGMRSSPSGKAWRRLSEAARTPMAPKLVAVVGRVGSATLLTREAVDNTSRYRALCAEGTGAFRASALCQGLRYRFAERSAWSRVFLALHRRSGTTTPDARDAAAILVGLRQELGLAARRPSTSPQSLLHGLYDQFGRCAPPACDPGLAPRLVLRSWLTAAAALARDHGNDVEAKAGTKLAELGWH